jgi:DNA-binding Lrp family transcriptional regulator
MFADKFDRAILAHLLEHGDATQAELGGRAHLSGPAAGRRQRLLEEKGVISGYRAQVDFKRCGFGALVMVMIHLERQSEETLSAFEEAIVRCPSVTSCHLLSGEDDYLITLRARDLADYERIHRTELSKIPGVARMRSSFALREVISRAAPPALLVDP